MKILFRLFILSAFVVSQFTLTAHAKPLNNHAQNLFSKLETSHALFELIANETEEDSTRKLMKELISHTKNHILPEVRVTGSKLHLSGLSAPIEVISVNNRKFRYKNIEWSYDPKANLDVNAKNLTETWFSAKSGKNKTSLFNIIINKAYAENKTRSDNKEWADLAEQERSARKETASEMQTAAGRALTVIGAGTITAIGIAIAVKAPIPFVRILGGAGALGGLLIMSSASADEATCFYEVKCVGQNGQFTFHGRNAQGPIEIRLNLDNRTQNPISFSFNTIEDDSGTPRVNELSRYFLSANKRGKNWKVSSRRILQKTTHDELDSSPSQDDVANTQFDEKIMLLTLEKFYNDCKNNPKKIAQANSDLQKKCSPFEPSSKVGSPGQNPAQRQTK